MKIERFTIYDPGLPYGEMVVTHGSPVPIIPVIAREGGRTVVSFKENESAVSEISLFGWAVKTETR